MALLFDYLYWRGDLSFSSDPANELDCYLISKIGCPDLTGLVSYYSLEAALPYVVSSFKVQDENENFSLGIATSPLVLKSFYRLPELERFKPLMLSGFRHSVDENNVEQFSALTVRVPDGPRYVTFRGTDDNIFAWKENFNMAVMDVIPAQEDALSYLSWAMDAYDGDFIVCGHSKGGNLAVYAASMLPEEQQDRITDIYAFDSPGFQDDFLEKEGYKRILPKLHSLVPQNSIVGLLLSTGKEPEIVTSDSFGAKAHDGFTWEVTGTGFKRADALSRSSAVFKNAIRETLSGMSLEERKTFIEGFFQIMTSTGAYTLTDLTEKKLVNAVEMIRSLGKNKEVQKFAMTMISNSLADLRGKL